MDGILEYLRIYFFNTFENVVCKHFYQKVKSKDVTLC